MFNKTELTDRRILGWVRQSEMSSSFTKMTTIKSACPCPSPLTDRSGDGLEDLMEMPCQVWFDTEAPEAFERDDLVTIATTEQHL